MDGPLVSGRGEFTARDRYATSRIVTSVLFGLAGLGATALHFALRPAPELADVSEIYAAAAIAATVAAWRGAGLSLGRGLAATTAAALGSAVAAGVLFSIAAGVRSVIAAYKFTQFRTAEALMAHLLDKAVEAAGTLLLSPALFPALLAAILAALLGEAARHAWDRAVIEPT